MRKLFERLRSDYVELWFDRELAGPPSFRFRDLLKLNDWVDFVLIVCTSAEWERHFATLDLYNDVEWTAKFVPILISGGNKEDIPESLRGRINYVFNPDDPGFGESYDRLKALISDQSEPSELFVLQKRRTFDVGERELSENEERRESQEKERLEQERIQAERPERKEEEIASYYYVPGPSVGAFDNPEAATSAPPITKPIPCHFSATIDEALVLMRATTVEVVLSRETLEEEISKTTAVSSGAVDVSRKIVVQIIPRANFEIVGDDRAECDPPEVDQPTRLYFDVRPTQLGEAELWVVIRQGQVPISTLMLKPLVVERRPRSVKQSPAEARVVMPKPLLEHIHQLRILEIFNGSECRYLYDLESPKLGLLGRFESAPLRGDRESYVKSIYSEIETRWVSNAGDVEAFNQDLRAYGAALFKALFPEQLQRILWENRGNLDSVMVISTEPFIPWEIVHLSEPGRPLGDEMRFLAQLGLVRWLHGNWPPEELHIGEGAAFYVIPDYPDRRWKLPEAQKEKEFLVQCFHAGPITPTPNDVRKCIAEGKFELLHFAGHGQAESNDISRAKIMLEGRMESGKYVPAYLESVTVQQFGRLGELHPIVVLNACQAGRLGSQLTSIGGFAKAFLEAGAGVFTGCLWSVGDDVSRLFIESWYRALGERRRLSEATIRAREAARIAGDGTWLAYTVYGHPHARLSCTLGGPRPDSRVEVGSGS